MPDPEVGCIVCGLPFEPGVIHEHHELDWRCRYTRRDYLRDALLYQLATVLLAKELRPMRQFEFPKEAVDALRAFRDSLPEAPPNE